MTNIATPPGAQDECATCGHARWRHKEVDGQQVCTEYVDCACHGVFVELPWPTRMARFVEAAQKLPPAMAAVRVAMTDAFRAFHGMHTAMQEAGLLPEDAETDLCDGCDRADQPVTATDDGRAQLCASCMRMLLKEQREVDQPPERAPALQRINPTFHRVDCDKNCDGTCTQWPKLHVQQLVDEHVRRGMSVPAGADASVLADLLSADDRRNARAADSCATCWPRPCERPGVAYRSKCRRRQPELDATRCPTCTHPWDYISDGVCTMPVLPGTNFPPSRADQRTDRCGCARQP